MSEGFRAGDQVMLKSGGPYMTVNRVLNDQVSCVWFHESDLKVGSFGAPLLRLRTEIEAENAEQSRRMTERMRTANERQNRY